MKIVFYTKAGTKVVLGTLTKLLLEDIKYALSMDNRAQILL